MEDSAFVTNSRIGNRPIWTDSTFMALGYSRLRLSANYFYKGLLKNERLVQRA